MTADEVLLTPHGYYELREKPTSEQLRQYYAQKYYQQDHSNYRQSYPESEVAYFRNRLEQHGIVVERMLGPSVEPRRLLDVGAGEGWALQHYAQRGWVVTGIDFSAYGCTLHNPGVADQLIVGEIDASLRALADSGETFDLIMLDNVLEHVLDPSQLLRTCLSLASADSVLLIEVPNDFSALQEQLLSDGTISRRFWVAVPDHLSYFNREGLLSLCQSVGWTAETVLGDFPIDFNLVNERTNYVDDPTAGPGCHQSRVALDNFFHGISPEKTVRLYEALADLGLGRQIVGFFRKTHN